MGLIKNNIINPNVMNSSLIDEVENLRFKNGGGFKYKGSLIQHPYAFKEAGPDYNNRHNVGSDAFGVTINGICGAPATRVGDTLVVDISEQRNLAKYLSDKILNFKQCHVGIGGHNDGTFSPQNATYYYSIMAY